MVKKVSISVSTIQFKTAIQYLRQSPLSVAEVGSKLGPLCNCAQCKVKNNNSVETLSLLMCVLVSAGIGMSVDIM